MVKLPPSSPAAQKEDEESVDHRGYQDKQKKQDHQENEGWEWGKKQDSDSFRRGYQQEGQQEEAYHGPVM